jgi:hypothetical protein
MDDVPQILERSMRYLADVKQCADVIMGPGILVKLFAVPRGDTQSVGDSKPTLWIVGSPNATKWTPRSSRDAHKANVIATNKASYAAGAGSASAFKPGVKAKVSGEKAGRQKEQRPIVKCRMNVAVQRVQEGHDESDDTSDEREEEEEEEEEVDTVKDDAGENDEVEDGAGEDIEEDLNEAEGEADFEEEQVEEAMVSDKSEHDTEEQDEDGRNQSSEQAEAGEADRKVNEEHESE